MASSGTESYLCASYSSVVRGFHVYKDIWTPVLNEVCIVIRQIRDILYIHFQREKEVHYTELNFEHERSE